MMNTTLFYDTLISILLVSERPHNPFDSYVRRVEGWTEVGSQLNNTFGTDGSLCDAEICDRRSDHGDGLQLVNERFAEALDEIQFWNVDTPAIHKQLKLIYERCLETENARGYGDKVLSQVGQLGGWPLLYRSQSGGNTGFWDISGLMGHMSSNFDIHILLQPGVKELGSDFVMRDFGELPSQYALYFGLPEFSVSTVDQIKRTVDIFAGRLGLTIKEADLLLDIDSIIAVEKMLKYFGNQTSSGNTTAKSYLDFKSISKNVFTSSTAAVRWPFLYWNFYLQALGEGLVPVRDILTAKFVIRRPDFLDKLSEVFGLIPRAKLQNFFIWKYLQRNMHLLYTSFDNRPQKQRKLVCLDTIKASLPFAASNLYLERASIDGSIEEVKGALSAMSDSLLKEFWTFTHRNRRISEEAKLGLKKKLETMKVEIGYPVWITNQLAIAGLHSSNIFNISADSDWIEIDRTLNRYRIWWQLAKLGRARHIYSLPWLGHSAGPLSSHPKYLPWSNTLVVPFGVVNRRYFDLGFPTAVNFAGVGTLIAGEIAKLFSVYSTQFNSYGQLTTHSRNEDEFRKIEMCLNETARIHCPSCASAGEWNQYISSHLGQTITKRTYLERTMREGPEPHLGNIWAKYSMEQIFHLWQKLLNCQQTTASQLLSATDRRFNEALSCNSTNNEIYFDECFGFSKMQK